MRSLALLVLLLGFATPGWAANTVFWSKLGSSTDGGTSLATGTCMSVRFTNATNETKLLNVSGQWVSIEFDPGSGASSVDVYSCVSPDMNRDGTTDVDACIPLLWDTDGDGIVDSSALDGAAAMRRSTGAIWVDYLLYLDPSLISTNAEAVVCSLSTK